MLRRIIAIAFIFGCAAVAWGILGTTIFVRTEDSHSSLGKMVASNWGTAQEQLAPLAVMRRESQQRETVQEQGKMVTRDVSRTEETVVPLVRSRVRVGLDLAHRQKGLLWYATYGVAFQGEYTFRNTTASDSLTIRWAFPESRAVYDDVTFVVNGAPMASNADGNGFTTTVPVSPGDSVTFRVGYRSQGMQNWAYRFGDASRVAQVRDFALQMHTNFASIDFPENSLSPSTKRETQDGWDLQWRYTNLVTGNPIAIVMPERLQPGPLAARISYFAPVSLFFFFFVMFVLTTIRGIELHPMNYFFLAAAFFAFHLLLAYLVDHISIHVAFLISSVVSIALVVSYLRLVVDWRFALRDAAPAQILFLVLFSYAFFFEGFTGLAITIGSIITLFVVMQMTGRVRWAEKFATPQRPSPSLRRGAPTETNRSDHA